MPMYQMPNPLIQSPSRFEVDEDIVDEPRGYHRWRVPRHYQVEAVGGRREIAVVPLRSVIIEGDGLASLYDRYRLLGLIRALRANRRLPPLHVTPSPEGLFQLNEGLDRFIACVVLGIPGAPVAYATEWLPRYRCA